MKTFECTSSDQGFGKKLSNLTPYRFIVDGIECASMEGFLQSLKTQDGQVSEKLRSMSGVACWSAGQKYTKHWQKSQTLYWNSIPYNRQSMGYQLLLNKAYDSLCENADFAKNLIHTKLGELTHNIGSNDSTKTLLTRSEFLYNLYRARSKLIEHRMNE